MLVGGLQQDKSPYRCVHTARLLADPSPSNCKKKAVEAAFFCAIYAYFNFQISSLYCRMVRSEEKYPDFAILTSIFFAQVRRSP